MFQATQGANYRATSPTTAGTLTEGQATFASRPRAVRFTPISDATAGDPVKADLPDDDQLDADTPAPQSVPAAAVSNRPVPVLAEERPVERPVVAHSPMTALQIFNQTMEREEGTPLRMMFAGGPSIKVPVRQLRIDNTRRQIRFWVNSAVLDLNFTEGALVRLQTYSATYETAYALTMDVFEGSPWLCMVFVTDAAEGA